jgi:hypothetical protein
MTLQALVDLAQEIVALKLARMSVSRRRSYPANSQVNVYDSIRRLFPRDRQRGPSADGMSVSGDDCRLVERCKGLAELGTSKFIHVQECTSA